MIRCSKPGRDHFVLAKLRRDVLKQGIAVGLRYWVWRLASTGRIRERVVAVAAGQVGSRQALHIRKNKNAATGLWFQGLGIEVLTAQVGPDRHCSEKSSRNFLPVKWKRARVHEF